MLKNQCNFNIKTNRDAVWNIYSPYVPHPPQLPATMQCIFTQVSMYSKMRVASTAPPPLPPCISVPAYKPLQLKKKKN